LSPSRRFGTTIRDSIIATAVPASEQTGLVEASNWSRRHAAGGPPRPGRVPQHRVGARETARFRLDGYLQNGRGTSAIWCAPRGKTARVSALGKAVTDVAQTPQRSDTG
jgi:hypothetical protein